jgi:hypothetical protein
MQRRLWRWRLAVKRGKTQKQICIFLYEQLQFTMPLLSSWLAGERLEVRKVLVLVPVLGIE